MNQGGNFTEPVNYKEIFSGAHTRELLVFITDFYQKENEIMHLLDALSLMKHEIIVFHVMGNNELELDYKGYTSLQDLETGETIAVQTGLSREAYTKKLEAHLAELRSQLLDRGIFYRMVNIQQPIDEVLRDFLNQRIKLKSVNLAAFRKPDMVMGRHRNQYSGIDSFMEYKAG